MLVTLVKDVSTLNGQTLKAGTSGKLLHTHRSTIFRSGGASAFVEEGDYKDPAHRRPVTVRHLSVGDIVKPSEVRQPAPVVHLFQTHEKAPPFLVAPVEALGGRSARWMLRGALVAILAACVLALVLI